MKIQLLTTVVAVSLTVQDAFASMPPIGPVTPEPNPGLCDMGFTEYCGPSEPPAEPPDVPAPFPAITPEEPADPAAAGDANNFGEIGENIVTSMSSLPGMLSGMSYMFALMLGTTAIMKIKNHVEDPLSVPIKEGAVRLLAGGALLALPIVYEAMFTTVGDTASVVSSAQLNAVAFNVE